MLGVFFALFAFAVGAAGFGNLEFEFFIVRIACLRGGGGDGDVSRVENSQDSRFR